MLNQCTVIILCTDSSADLPADIQNLIERSFEAKEKSYSPYSHFPVGAAILSKDGTVFTGEHDEAFNLYR